MAAPPGRPPRGPGRGPGRAAARRARTRPWSPPGALARAPFLRGETPADAARAAHLPVPDLWPGVVAFRTADGPRDPAYVVPDGPGGRAAAARRSRTRRGADGSGPRRPISGGRRGSTGPGRPLRVVEGRRALRWAIDIAAPLAPRGRRWGDDPFARSLAAALERRGQWVTVDHPETRARGLARPRRRRAGAARPRAGGAHARGRATSPARLLWVISHPAEVTAAGVRAVRPGARRLPRLGRGAAPQDWGREVRPLLQCTDATRFHPGLAEPDTRSGGAVRRQLPGRAAAGGAGRARRRASRSRSTATAGPTWSTPPWSPGVHVPNDDLGRALRLRRAWCSATTGPTCATLGFVSNRTFDVLATGARLLSDDVRRPGGAATPTCSTSRCRPGADPADLRPAGRARLARGLPRPRRAAPRRRAGGRRALLRRPGRPSSSTRPSTGCRPTPT